MSFQFREVYGVDDVRLNDPKNMPESSGVPIQQLKSLFVDATPLPALPITNAYGVEGDREVSEDTMPVGRVAEACEAVVVAVLICKIPT